ncbi:hypothetical protein [Xanthobacter sediminis]
MQRALLAALLAAPFGAPGPAGALDLDTPPPPAPRVDLGLPQSAPATGARRSAPRGNPLWAIPLATLSATRERPIFSPSRRPPPEDGAPAGEPDATPAEAKSSETPNLTLVGTIAGPDGGFGIFLQGDSQDVLRLRTGEAHDGWVLKSVKARDVTLSNGETTVTLSLPARDEGEGTVSHESHKPAAAADKAAPAEGEAGDMANTPESGDTAAPAEGEASDTANTPEAGDMAAPADGEASDTATPPEAGDMAPAEGETGTPDAGDGAAAPDGEAADTAPSSN